MLCLLDSKEDLFACNGFELNNNKKKQCRLPVTMVMLRQTNQPTKRDDRAGPLISPLHNAEKASTGPPMARLYCKLFVFKYIFIKYK